jgi:beta-lactam-binding protein with PASTA domain
MRLPLPSRPRPADRRGTRAQTVVEFALVAPVLILLLLIAIDVGRVFLGWVALNNAARVGANYAAANPNETWGSGSDYQALIDANIDAINCVRSPSQADPPVFTASTDPGEPVTVALSCDFTVVTPGIAQIIGGTVTVSSSSTFPITYGCLADCPSGPPAPPPPPPPDNCRTVPDVVGMSVAGARAAWVAAGFSASEFDPASGDDTRTVASQDVDEPLNEEGCTGNKAFFAASMTVTLEDLGPVTSPTCIHVPNLRGVTVATARQAWTDAGFAGSFLPTGNDSRIVIDQVTDPTSDPGDCVEPDTSVTVSHGAPPAPPPPPPCKVPSFVNTSSSAATGTWTAAGFDADNISFSRGGTFTIQSQSLVGGTYVSCTASIEVSHRAGNNP